MVVGVSAEEIGHLWKTGSKERVRGQRDRYGLQRHASSDRIPSGRHLR